MSGGVDSSVSAALLKQEGYDVIGVFIKVWQADFLPCTWREERRDAMRAAAHLGIPFLTLDLEKEYKKEVVDYMIREYGKGRVPNPDVMCNTYVKFGAFLEYAKKHGADFIATGHYARRDELGDEHRLRTGLDTKKDQSYFLWMLSQKALGQTLFPIGHLQKSEVRKLARTFGLLNAEKKDSQGLCFMGKVDVADFLKHYLKAEKGDVLNDAGSIIGTHDGAMLYTIGQRHGFSTEKSSSAESPYFVIGKDLQANTITVAHFISTKRQEGTVIISVEGFNDIEGDFHEGKEGCVAQIRYHGAYYPVFIRAYDSARRFAQVELTSLDQNPAAGQSIVFYQNDTCLGGGVISE